MNVGSGLARGLYPCIMSILEKKIRLPCLLGKRDLAFPSGGVKFPIASCKDNI